MSWFNSFSIGRLPAYVLKGLFQAIFMLLYRVEVTGSENIDRAGPRALVVVNHVSNLDGPLMMAFLSELPAFAVSTECANRWWVKPFRAIASIYPVDPTRPMEAKSLVAKVKEGRPVVIFPEGRVSVTGALMKIYPGPAFIADKAGAAIVPVRIDGAELGAFSCLKRGEVRRHRFPKIRITILEPRCLQIDNSLDPRTRRSAAVLQLYDIMSEMHYRTTRLGSTLFEALLIARRRHGGTLPIIEDFQQRPFSYNRLITATMALGQLLAKETEAGDKVGVLLPNAVGTAVTFFALQAYGRIPAMLNFSTSAVNMEVATKTAQIRIIIASREFVARGRLEPLVRVLGETTKILWLEDLQDRIGFRERLKAFWNGCFARRIHDKFGIVSDAPAVVLFTSGTEGRPKAVVLSHRNLLANCAQAAARVDYNQLDKCFDALPVFHAFGLTGAFLLPCLSGVAVFLYPSPLHYQIVPEVVYESDSTIIFGTNTFLKGYGRKADPYDFRSVRYVFSGAEALQEETDRLYAEKFGLRILTGYGMTETSPVVTMNTAMHNRSGTVGRFLPGIKWRLEPIEGLKCGGRLWIKGPNVMLGYIRHDKPGAIEPPQEGWYDTGDIVDVDEEGYVRILGRAKRFAKIAGEMISLAAAETLVNELWPGTTHAIVRVPDVQRGESLILVTEDKAIHRAALMSAARNKAISDLAVPTRVICVDKVPVLITGKPDYVAVQQIAEESLGQKEAV